MNIQKPTPITKWKTTDGRIHDDEDTAERHETVTAVLANLPARLIHMSNTLYAPLMEINKHFHIVKVPKPGSEA